MRTIVRARDVESAAPPEQVWDVLADLAAHEAWTPAFRLRAPAVRAGGRCTVVVGLLPGPPVLLPCRFERVERGVALSWGASVGPLARVEHVIALEPVGTGTLIRHHETFGGVAGPPLAPLQGVVAAQYTAMSERLAARAEALVA